MLIQRFKIVTITAALTLAIGAIAALQLPAKSQAAAACTRLASSSGNDAAAGTPAAPWRTVTKLLSSLQSGDVACLAAGQTFGSANAQLSLTTGNVTLQSAPGSPATLIGLFSVSGTGSTVTGLNLDGHNNFPVAGNPATAQGQAGLFIAGNNVSIIGNNITNGHTAICIEVGINRVSGAVIDGNRIHGCGILPMTRLEHGIYIDTAVGTRITNNLIYDIADFGIQAYPDVPELRDRGERDRRHGHAAASRSGPRAGTPSSGNVVRRNIIVNSKGPPVATYWGGEHRLGQQRGGHTASSNTLAQSSYAGLTVSGTKVVASSGLDASYKLGAGAACAGYGPAASQALGGSGGVSPPPPPPPPPAPAAAGGSEAPGSAEGGPAKPVTGSGGRPPRRRREAASRARRSLRRSPVRRS